MSEHDEVIGKLRDIIAARGGELYGGEAVTQEQHALQCAQLAEDEGAPDHLIAAALMHDIGHLMEQDFEDALERGEDRFHENVGNRFLSEWFGREVTEPVRLHVAAKRYLCATDPVYLGRLSPASVQSLRIQGGPMSADEVVEFENNPCSGDAVRLRRWDDTGKDPQMKTADIDHFLSIVGRVVKT